MGPFGISEVLERFGEKIIYVNPLPSKHCTFDCVFCPMEARTVVKTEENFKFAEMSDFLIRMENTLQSNRVDKVFIMPDGEGLANADLEDIIKLSKRYGCKVKIITNGYVLNHPKYMELMLQCDEVIGELMTVKEEDFQKLQRPVAGFSLTQHVNNMAEFRSKFTGKFNLSITLLKGYSDSPEALAFFKSAAAKIKPDHIEIETPEDGKLQEVFGVNEGTIKLFEEELKK